MNIKTLILLLLFTMALHEAGAQELMKYSDVFKLPVDTNKTRLSYGADPLQFGDLRLPEGDGPHKVVVIIHGGCWVSAIATTQPTGVTRLKLYKFVMGTLVLPRSIESGL